MVTLDPAVCDESASWHTDSSPEVLATGAYSYLANTLTPGVFDQGSKPLYVYNQLGCRSIRPCILRPSRRGLWSSFRCTCVTRARRQGQPEMRSCLGNKMEGMFIYSISRRQICDKSDHTE